MTDVPAARAVLQVLRVLRAAGQPVSAGEIVRELDLPRSSVYKLLGALRDEGFVIHLPEERRYALSLRAARLVADDLTDLRLERMAVPLLRRLVRRVNGPVVAHLSLLRGADVVYRATVDDPAGPRLLVGPGIHLPAHLTASGRAMLAHLPTAQVRATYPTADALVHRTGRGPRTPSGLRRLLEGVAERGWAREVGEVVADLASVAVAVLDDEHNPVAAVGLTWVGTEVPARIGTWQHGAVPTQAELAAQTRITADALAMRVRGRL
ncbi:IclR family transcriptional regulator [Actinotalea sp. M2MS4P-6]|uniref:IclR family transcriptional regulator n=1 Tax=Actinotalea sp. M2MS4P-6 TaxID=2983762 RepID=UPI0021E4776C|nr:IclR family transcriptional regulator [Actinotalea sp. M2MS4P-6]MCV2394369.1 IclR family transcriptional regulator [Actinotalea sp. M2MS4P-6]